MRRAYVDVSHFRSPYDSPTLSLSGFGALPRRWPVGRSYVDVAHFRAPYDQGYFQDNQLFGLGADPAGPSVPVALPPPPAPTDSMLGSTLALIGIGSVVGAAGAYIVLRGRKQSA
jgi:hypothetical protein